MTFLKNHWLETNPDKISFTSKLLDEVLEISFLKTRQQACVILIQPETTYFIQSLKQEHSQVSPIAVPISSLIGYISYWNYSFLPFLLPTGIPRFNGKLPSCWNVEYGDNGSNFVLTTKTALVISRWSGALWSYSLSLQPYPERREKLSFGSPNERKETPVKTNSRDFFSASQTRWEKHTADSPHEPGSSKIKADFSAMRLTPFSWQRDNWETFPWQGVRRRKADHFSHI